MPNQQPPKPSYKPMQAGRLRRKITIQQQTRTSDGAGGAAVSWVTVLTTWAQPIDLHGSELWAAEQVSARNIRKFAFRYPPSLTLTPPMRLIDGAGDDIAGADIYNIRNIVEPAERRQQMVATCELVPGYV